MKKWLYRFFVLSLAVTPAAAQLEACLPAFCQTTPPSACVNSGHAAAFLARTTGLDATHVTAYTDFLNSMDSDNLTCLFDFIYIYATQDSTTALLNLVKNNFNGAINGAPTFVPDTGFSSTNGGTTDYIATGFNPTVEAATSQLQQNAGHIALWSLTNATNIYAAFGAYDSGVDSHYYIFPKYSDNNAYYRLNANGAGAPLVAMADPLGHYITTRDGTSIEPYKNGISPGTQFETSQPIANFEFYAAAHNSSGTASGSTLIVASASAGALLDATQSLNYYTHLRTYMTAVGVP